MTEFHVEYRIEVDAETHEQAARKVARMLANGGARRGVYEVKKRGAGVKYEHDLGEIDGTWTDVPDDTDWVAEIDAVLEDVEASTDADDMESVFDARDAAADLLRRVRELMAVPGADEHEPAAEAAPMQSGTLVWHVFSGPDSEGGVWLQQGPKTEDHTTPDGFDLVAYDRPDESCVDFITAASAREAEAIYRAWLEREGIVIPDGA